jgi:hypothetical protein
MQQGFGVSYRVAKLHQFLANAFVRGNQFIEDLTGGMGAYSG